MRIEIIIPPSLQPLTGEAGLVTVSGGTVGQCLEELVRRYPKVRSRIFTKNGKLPQGLSIFINKEAAYPGELARPVHDSDKLYLSYIVMGG
jgi:molybdopterin converting factor small subunit